MAASAIFSTPGRTTTICSLSTCSSSSTSLNFRTPQLALTHFPQYRWSGLRQLGFPISQQSLKLERRSKSRRKVIVASLFGVGAPEALVIGVVALLVFGPKGLAEVARNLGKTLRAFQPTIRELQDVSREFKTTLEKEIGLDEIQNPMRSNYSSTPTTPISRPAPVATPEDSQAAVDPSSTPTTPIPRPAPVANPEDSQATVDPNGTPSPNKAYSTEDYLKITEEQLKAAASVQQEEQTPPSVAGNKLDPQSEAQDTLQEGAGATPPVHKPKDES